MPRRAYAKRAKKGTRKSYRRKYPKKKYAKRAKVTNRRIASVASTKKQDTMLGAQFVTDKWIPGSGTVPCDTGNHTFLWTPTGRLRDPDENQRNRQTVFAKGVYDRWRLTTTDSSVWTWRRIIFRSHIKYSDGLAYNNTKTYFRNCQIDTAQHQAVLEDLLTGTVNADWVDPMLGKIDRTHITILSDRIRYLRPKGEKGDLHVYDQYIPINRNITYNDEEVLGGDNSQPWASDSRANPGNVYVFDIMKSNNGTGAPLRYACESTYYWHEK